MSALIGHLLVVHAEKHIFEGWRLDLDVTDVRVGKRLTDEIGPSGRHPADDDVAGEDAVV
jgi:hypothetical protein